MGAGLVLFGLLLQVEAWSVGIRLVMIAIFLWITSPMATHALAQSAWAHGVEPILDRPMRKIFQDGDDEGEGDQS